MCYLQQTLVFCGCGCITSARLAANPGQAGSVQYSQFPSQSSVLLHQGESPSIEVHLSWILLLKMKGNTQLPQFPEPMEEVVVVEGDVVVVEKLSLQVADSSPRAAKENLFSVMTLALSDRSTTPVAVWETG